jgi:sodium-dependent dicarboxylate transporter 2/3/5
MGLLALALVVILFTEFLSNTAVAVAFFPVAARMAAGLGLAPMTAMLTVTTASCLSFATPVATPCNALAFGMIPGVRLRRMMACGLVMNLIAAAALGLWLPLAIPRLYG